MEKKLDDLMTCEVCGEVFHKDKIIMLNDDTLQACVECAWNEIPSCTQDALIEWYNVRELDEDDYKKLIKLNRDGNFYHANCFNCGEPILQGQPDDWDEFQGVNETEGIGELCGECYQYYLQLKEAAGD